MKEGEFVTSYIGSILVIANKIEAYGENLKDVAVVEKDFGNIVETSQSAKRRCYDNFNS